MPTETIQLPDKPSELIRLAISDLEKCERDKRYRIDMDSWHEANSHCAVCLAGSVMAKTLGVSPSKTVAPYDYRRNPSVHNKLMALDYFRLGWIRDGVKEILPKFDTRVMKERDARTDAERPTPYSVNPAKFKSDMLRIATLLETHYDL